jgi:alcohol dehydrogenase class IV
MRSPLMIPSVAIVDPELTYSMPPAVTASTGMDALTQVIEAYVSNKANPMTDAIAREGIERGARSLLDAYQDGSNAAAREDMALTSLFGGLVLANAGLGAVHGFAGPIGGMFNAPHGVICACLLPYVMKYNAQVVQHLPEMAHVSTRFRDVAQWVTGNPDADIQDGVKWIEALAHDLQIPGLHVIGIEKSDFPQIIEKSKVSSSMQKNPVRLDEEILEAILTEAY